MINRSSKPDMDGLQPKGCIDGGTPPNGWVLLRMKVSLYIKQPTAVLVGCQMFVSRIFLPCRAR